MLDLPIDRGSPTSMQYLAVTADPWPGAMAVWRGSGEGAPLDLRAQVDYPACLGETLTALPPGPLWRFDRHASLDVALRHGGALSAIPEDAALAGGNLFALRGADGAIEILTAAGVELIGEGRYRLTRLLRGLAGSEAAAGRIADAGGLIVRLDDGAVVPLVDRLDEVGRPFRYRIGPAGRDPADPLMVELEAAAGLTALRPLAPVHLRAVRTGEGVHIAWTRRARRDADAWEPPEIPLDEPGERYVLDLHGADGGLVRSLTATASGVLYSAAAEVADFGGAQNRLDVAVAQVGNVAGRGPATRSRVPVRVG